jgi:pyruvate/2-oxoglutarate dehydrogenase complex dihydrolipoamide dehydrogenase (E3) component
MTVLVVGGGVAGMQAALTAAKRGHRVILCEKEERLGGALLCEEKVPFKKLLAGYLYHQARMLSRATVELRLNTAVTPGYADEVGADVLIAALGARPLKPAIPGIDGDNVMDAESAYCRPERVGQRVVIVGGGLVGIELAIHLSALGREVTNMEMMETLSDGGNPVHGLALINEINRYRIQVTTATRAVQVSDEGVMGEYVGSAFALPPCPTVQAAVLQSNSFNKSVRADAEMGSKNLFEADSVVYATGREPLRAEVDELRFCAPEFREIGDCWMARNVQQATRITFAVARDL